jgi:hypothetical protein
VIKIISASADTYITNRIVNNYLRATDANVGNAGTLDLFKLYNETKIVGEATPIELTRVLLKFDLEPIRKLTGSLFDPGSSSFKCKIKMKDVYGGSPTPTNFSLILHPLSKSFDEGVGRDIIRFDDIDVANFLTASYQNGAPVLWSGSGASAEGTAGNPNIDIISDVNFGSGLESVTVVQSFEGAEDLVMDVTKIVSGTLAGFLPDCGFRLAFSGSAETDDRTRFVKRFASRHASSPSKRPYLEVSIDDSVRDNHANMVFNTSGSLFLRTSARGIPSNALSGSSAVQLTGSNCMTLKITSGTFSRSFDVSQATIGGIPRTGLYVSTFAINQFSEPLFSYLKNASSASFAEVWGSRDGTVGYHTGSLVVNLADAYSFKPQTRSLYARVTNCKTSYTREETPRLILFIEDLDEEVVFSRFPRENNGHVYPNVFYGVRDAVSGEVVVPFLTDSGGTRASSAEDGMFFDFHMDALQPGRTYEFRILVRDLGEDLVLEGSSPKFRVTE